MTYTATITSASLRLREGRIIAGLLLKGVSQLEWKQATLEQNVRRWEAQNLSGEFQGYFELG